MASDNLKTIKYCPHCGNPDFSPNRSNAWRCSSCEFIYFHNSAAAAAAILMFRKQILLTVRKSDPGKNMLDLPGGFVDPGESLEGALTREINEELKIHVENWKFLFSYPNRYEFKGVAYNTTDAFFRTDFGERPHVTACDDVADIIWMPIHDIDVNEIALSSIRMAIQRLKRSHSSRR
jgi:ADP-ribose pyrophosphatase YjhB (NUDIX family)